MIESSISVRDDMVEIQTEYAHEIEEVIQKICRKDSPTSPAEESSTDLSLFTGTFDETPPEESQNEQPDDNQKKEIPEMSTIPEGLDSPDWAKRLWKAIAKKCHPDRLSFQELTAIQIARRQTWFLEARKLFEEQRWNHLLHIGVQLEEFVDDITSAEQLKMLNVEYSGITNKVEDVQKSIAWRWGTNWDNLELRVKILTAVLVSKGLEVPPKLQLIQILVNLELD